MSERLEAGTLVDGRYQVESRLGSGGMADVFLATDTQLGRRVALKLLYRRFAQDPEFVERFRREASAAAGLQHQNVVSVYDRGEWDDTYYIAMEYLEGRSLKALIHDEAPLEPARAIDLATQILRAARFAHRRGVIHRDLKPHNVIVDDEGRATVTDFGIARAGASDMTQTGSIMGTAQYLSPEQAQGHAVSAQSDLYSIGIILYEMLTGRVPFEGDSAVAIALKQVGEAPVPPSVYNAAVSPALEAAVLRALEKDPAARYPDADAFITALEAAAAGAGPPTQATMVGAVAAVGAIPTGPSVYPQETIPPSYGHPPPAHDGGAPPEDEGPSRRWWLFAIGAVVVVGAVIAALLLLRTPQVVVPNVVGTDQATAEAVLARAGFSVDTVVKTSTLPVHQVLGQDPPPGQKADKGSLVTLTVSDGPGTAVVPPVNGMSASQAKRLLESKGFKVSVRDVSSDTVPAGDAVDTQPPEGTTLERGQTVTLHVSSGKAQVVVPDVVGQALEDARAALTNAGFTVTVTSKEDTATPGTVLSQSPAAQSKADQGSAVALVVAKKPSQVAVPNTVGDDEATAIQTLSGAGFKVTTKPVTVTNEQQDGTVIKQSPSGGKAKPGSTVTIGVGNFTPPTQSTPTTTTEQTTTTQAAP
ncbi:MAG TPA: Stk1 family PASTA domain-containing Ser/Thr kinase [Solirubrobacteraceae bacterium]|nr:Stk1 family PASTA domain-containing Ser/Thr kinase [Solirubrobacteraceae bacterium]